MVRDFKQSTIRSPHLLKNRKYLPTFSRSKLSSIKKHFGRRFKIFMITLSVIFLILFVVFGIPAISFYFSARTFKNAATDISKHIREDNYTAIQKDLDKIEQEFPKITAKTKRFSYLSFIPGTKPFFADAEYYASAGQHGIKAMKVVFQMIEPHKELLNPKSDDEEDISGNKMVSALRVLPYLSPRFDEVAQEIHAARLEMDKIDSTRYPKTIKGIEIQQNLYFAIDMMRRFDNSSSALKMFLGKVPNLIGDPGTGDRTYLLLFQNDKELRPSGGFLTSYAIIKLTEGNVSSVESADPFDLDKDCKITQSCLPPNELTQKYLLMDHWFARDANLSPDYVESAKMFYEFWQKRNMPKIDGIFAMDTEVPRAMLEVLGGVKVEGYDETFTSENVIDILTKTARERREMANRKELVGLLMKSLEGMIFDAPQEKWAPLAVGISKMLYEKHLLFYVFEPESQAFFDEINFAGRVRDVTGDYLYLNDANFAGGKGDLYIKRNVTKEVSEESGRLVSTVSINYQNTGEFEKEINPGYKSYLRVLLPKGTEYISSSGSQEAIKLSEELNKTVIEAFVVVDPKNESSIQFKYRLPENVNFENYKLLIQKQPGKAADPYTLNILGQTKNIDLYSDYEYLTK